jgi:hypothetical protein
VARGCARKNITRLRCDYYEHSDDNRCNYAHPGDALRIAMHAPYYDEEYAELLKLHGDDMYPKGVYI